MNPDTAIAARVRLDLAVRHVAAIHKVLEAEARKRGGVYMNDEAHCFIYEWHPDCSAFRAALGQAREFYTKTETDQIIAHALEGTS